MKLLVAPFFFLCPLVPILHQLFQSLAFFLFHIFYPLLSVHRMAVLLQFLHPELRLSI